MQAVAGIAWPIGVSVPAPMGTPADALPLPERGSNPTFDYPIRWDEQQSNGLFHPFSGDTR